MANQLRISRCYVQDVMSKDVVCLDAADTIHEALNLLVENRVAALPVVDGKGRCVGMLSTSDLVDTAREMHEDLLQLDEITSLSGGWLLEKLRRGFGESNVNELMTRGVELVRPDCTVQQAACEMLRHQVHRLPVVDDHQRVVGIISTTDILTVVAENSSNK